jgi:hypothetical protein
MKKTALVALFVLGTALAAAAGSAADRTGDFQAIQKAVKQNPAYEEGKEVKWFKVLVTDAKTNKDKVRITMPIGLLEVLANCAGDKALHVRNEGADIDLKVLLAELKKMGPMALIEIYEEDEIIKVWLE